MWKSKVLIATSQRGTGVAALGLASDDVTKLSNALQRGKLVLIKGSVPYKSMLGEKSLTWRSSLFLPREVRTVFTTPSQLSASHFKRYWGSDKCGAVFQSIDDLPACFCMGRYLCLEPILPVATPVAGLWRSACKPSGVAETSGKKSICSEERHTKDFSLILNSVPETLPRMLKKQAAKDGASPATRRAKLERLSGVLSVSLFLSGGEFP